jgi:hypothetical protein
MIQDFPSYLIGSVTRFFVQLLVRSLRSPFGRRGSLVIENLARRQQLAAYARYQKRVHVEPQERMFWVALSKMWTVWRSALVIVKPETSSHGIVVVSNDIGVGVRPWWQRNWPSNSA